MTREERTYIKHNLSWQLEYLAALRENRKVCMLRMYYPTSRPVKAAPHWMDRF